MWAMAVLVVAAIAVTVIVLVAFPDPEIGDCVRDNTGGIRTKIVDCGDPSARYRVLDKIPGERGMTEEEAEGRACADHPEGTPKVFFRGRPRGVDFAICMTPIT